MGRNCKREKSGKENWGETVRERKAAKKLGARQNGSQKNEARL